jgi:hypothetical protein
VDSPRERRPPSSERIIQPRRPSPKFHDERDLLADVAADHA